MELACYFQWAVDNKPFKIKASIDMSSLKNLDKGLGLKRPSIIKARYRTVPQPQRCQFHFDEPSF